MLDAIHHLERLFLPPPAQAGSPLLGMWTAILHGYGALVRGLLPVRRSIAEPSSNTPSVSSVSFLPMLLGRC